LGSKKQGISPPAFPLKLLKWLCKPEYHSDIEGDLLELYHRRVVRAGQRRAGFLLFKDVMLLCRPGIIKTVKPIHNFNFQAMLRHNLLISFRNFWRNQTAFLINLSGLSTGLACTLLIFLWIVDELSIDKFHEKDAQLYQVMANYSSPDGVNTAQFTPSPLAEALAAEMPEVEYAVSLNPFFDWFKGPGIISYETNQVKTQGIFASKDFFKVFSYKLIEGNEDQVLAQKNGIVISERLAVKLFKTTVNITGKLIEWNHRMRFDGPLYISGVFENPPANSTSQFDIIFNYKKLLEGDAYSDKWNGNYAETCLILKDGTDISAFNKTISGFLMSKEPTNNGALFVTRYSSKYLYGNYENGAQSGGRIRYVRLFFIIGLFTLTIACINFINLSTAQASRKMKEVGVKKALGVTRGTLVVQFLTESVILAFLSLVIAILLTFLLLPNFNLLTNKHLSFNLSLAHVFGMGAIVLITGILSGSYPAFYLSGFKPVATLKGKITTSFGEQLLRKGLVMMQFTISIIFIVAFIVINKQIEYVQTRNLGYTKDNVISFQRQGDYAQNDYEAFIAELKKLPGVVNASSIFGSILNREIAMHTGFSWEGQTPEIKGVSFPSPSISHDFIETLGIELKEGRTFSGHLTGEESKIVVNEAAVKMMALEEPIGKTISYGSQEKQIIGVVRDFHYGSLHSSIEPVFFMYAPGRSDMVVKIQPGMAKRTIEGLQEVYKKFHPGYPFEFTFLDEDYQALYESENTVSILSTYFAILAILISCLGLFGLSSFTAQQRTKEIGIRKILGASTARIVQLLAIEVAKPVLVAVAISLPVSYMISKSWLSSFAYRIELHWWFFIGAGLLAIAITWITIGLQTLRAAHVNPVKSLKAD
jgi:ABC-type antimicrobial peptide transport system permease subunit